MRLSLARPPTRCGSQALLAPVVIDLLGRVRVGVATSVLFPSFCPLSLRSPRPALGCFRWRPSSKRCRSSGRHGSERTKTPWRRSLQPPHASGSWRRSSWHAAESRLKTVRLLCCVCVCVGVCVCVSVLCSLTLTLSHSHTLTLSHSHTLSLSHPRTHTHSTHSSFPLPSLPFLDTHSSAHCTIAAGCGQCEQRQNARGPHEASG